ncbi:YfhO family protein [bacterium]|nr:YfhO family protein [bacterium]
MGKKKRKKKTIQEKSSAPIWQQFGKTEQWIGAIILLIVLLSIYWAPILFDGLSPTGSDVIGGMGKTHQINEYYKETGEKALWNPYIFSGMPQYYRSSSNEIALDKIIALFYGSNNGVMGLIYYFIGALGMLLLMRYWGVPLWGACLAAVAFIFTPQFEVWFQAGHFQKFRPIMWIPWVILTFDYFLKKGNLLSTTLFIIIFSTQIRTKHYQIIFYTFLFMLFFGIANIIQRIKSKEYKILYKRAAFLLISALAVILLSLQSFWPAQEYAPYSIRGGTGEEESTGLDYNYATSWSLAPKEMLSFLIPRAYGERSIIVYDGDDIPQLKGRQIPGYWGEMPFTEGADYILGIITFILGMIGLIEGFRQKNRLIVTFGIFIVFAFLVSFGRHFPPLYNFFFQYVPMFNKFRIPQMILIMIYFSFACLAGFGFKALIEIPSEDRTKLLKWVIGITIVLIFLSLTPYLFKGSFSFESIGDAAYDPQVVELLKAARYDLMKQDASRLLIITVLGCAAIASYLKSWLNKTAMALLLAGLLLVDLIPVNKRFQNLDSVEQIEQSRFSETDIDRFLQKDQSLFRIFALVQDPFQDNNWSYDYQSIGGYDAAKLRIYQDIIESCIYNGPDPTLPINWNIVNMLNTKYIIVPQQITHPNLALVMSDISQNRFVYQNKGVLPRAFFVDNVEIIPDKSERLDRLNDPQYNPAQTAILENEFDFSIENPSNSDVNVTDFEPNRIELDVRTNTNGLLVLSEIYYPHGWKATIDGQETEIYKTNHILRSIVVPEGNHQIRFEFKPVSFLISAILSGISNGLALLLILIIGPVRYILRRKRQ